TITSAVLVERSAVGDFATSIDFTGGTFGDKTGPRAGVRITGKTPGAEATLTHDPLLDWGNWTDGTATGAFIIKAGKNVQFAPQEALTFEGGNATARGLVVRHQHWCLVEDGGYPPDM